MQIFPFRAIRPGSDVAASFASLPYDVIDDDELRSLVHDKSFLRVIRSECDFEKGVDIYSEKVYDRARQNLEGFISEGVLKKDEEKSFYIFEQTFNGRTQSGIVCLLKVSDYEEGHIKKHEKTLKEKETDRINHFTKVGCQTEPVFFVYKHDDRLKKIIDSVRTENEAVYDFDFSSTHDRLFKVSDKDLIDNIENEVMNMEAMYIADGHHRTESVTRVSEILDKKVYPGVDYIMAVCFDSADVYIMDYNRLLHVDLTDRDIVEELKDDFDVVAVEKGTHTCNKHTIAMYTDSKMYLLTAKPGSFDETDSVASLDASILQKNVFEKLFQIADPKTDKRLSFAGGIKGYEYLMEKVDKKEAGAAFMLYPVQMDDIIKVADDGKIMPPKSTWFEPKLTSGLFIYDFKDR